MNIADVGATLVYSLGLEVPSDLDGRVSESIFTGQHLDRNPVIVGAATSCTREEEGSENMSDEDKEKLLAQLKLLGYL
jgi:hypothetical protein